MAELHPVGAVLRPPDANVELHPVGPVLRSRGFVGVVSGGTIETGVIETRPYTYLRFTDAAGSYEDAPIDLGAIKTVALLIAVAADGPVAIERRSRLDASDPWGQWEPHNDAAMTARQLQVRLLPQGVPRQVRQLAVQAVSAV